MLSFPFQLRFLLASYAALMGKVLGIAQRVLSTPHIKKAGFKRTMARTGAVTPAKRGGGHKRCPPAGESWLDKTKAEHHASMTWMQGLKRVFNIDIGTCDRCSGQVKIIACIE